MRTRLLLPLLTAATLALTGCTGSDSEGGGGAGGDSSALAERLETARTTIDDAETIELVLEAPELPSGVTGLLSAEGTGNHSPAFEGEARLSTGAGSVSADVIAVDGQVYVSSPLLGPSFTNVPPSSLGAPDPAALLSADDGITTILSETDDLAEGDRSRDGSDVLTEITGTLAGTVIAPLIPTATESSTFDVTYRLDEDDVLRDATITGEFYQGSDAVTYTVTLTTSDEPVTIEAP